MMSFLMPTNLGSRHVLTALCCLTLLSGTAKALPPIPATDCMLIDKQYAPVIDGSLDDPVWAKATETTTFFGHWGGAAHSQGKVRIATDEQWIYVAFIASETNMQADHTEVAEIFLVPDLAQEPIVELVVRLNGRKIKNREVRSFELADDAWRAAYKVYDDHYVVEFALPISKLFAKPLERGGTFGLNMVRQRKRPGSEAWDIWCWSATGTSPGNRSRVGEVVFGRFADRIAVLSDQLQETVAAADQHVANMSEQSTQKLAELQKEVQAFVRKGKEKVTADQWPQLKGTAESLDRRLRRVALAHRGVIVRKCNPMDVPRFPSDLPEIDVEDATHLDIRVLGDEWETEALAVWNMTGTTLDGQVIISEFVGSDGKTKVPGWDVLQVRTAPLFKLLTGQSKRDPLPKLQEGDLFRVASGENELLWLTFKTRGLAPGRYTATLTVRALDDRVKHDIKVALRVYPLKLGPKGKPRLNAWGSWLRGKTAAEKIQHARDYYVNVFVFPWPAALPHLKTDAGDKPLGQRMDFAEFDQHMELYLSELIWTGFDFYLFALCADRAKTQRLWPAPEDKLGLWLADFKEHLNAKGIGPERWALYVADEAAPGAPRDLVLRVVKKVNDLDPDIQTYATIAPEGDPEQVVEMSKHMDIMQQLSVSTPTLKRIEPNLKELWHYSIFLRTESPFFHYRRELCAEQIRTNHIGTGFWTWDEGSQAPNLWYDRKHARFSGVYDHHDNTIVPSMRIDALREGIEDWKYVLMLDEAIKRAKDKNIAASTVAAAATFRTEGLSLMDDPYDVYKFRDQARDHLLALHVALGDIDDEMVKAVTGEPPPPAAGQSADDVRLDAIPWKLQFSDSFDRNELGDDWKTIGGNWSIDDGRLTGRGTIMCVKKFSGNQKMEFDAASDDPCDLTGLICSNDGGFAGGYFFGFGSDSNSHSKLMIQGRQVKDYYARAKPGKVHHVVCQRQGNTLTHMIDGKVVMQHAVDAPLTGKNHESIGFYVFTSARIDNVKVYTKGE